MFDAIQVGNWQRGGDDKAPKPRPLPRPGVIDPDDAKQALLRRLKDREVTRER